MAHTPSEPHPEDSRKPDSPTELTKPSWKYVLRSTIREVGDDGLTDLAAGLTYYTVLSIFPGLIALVSILSLFGQSADAVTGILDQVATVVPASTMDTIRPVLEGLLTAPAPGLGLIIGILTALWSASNYVKAFGRAMNVVYEVPEGRGPVKLNLGMYGLTAAILVLLALSLVLLAASGPILQAVGDLMGLGEVFLTVFSIVKWPILLVVAIVIVALLYYFTPNVRQPKMRWISPGAIIAIVLGGLAGVAFLGGLRGQLRQLQPHLRDAGRRHHLPVPDLDSEPRPALRRRIRRRNGARARQLQGGVAAEEDIQLPPRDTKASDKKEQKLRKDVAEGRRIRIEAARNQKGPRQAPIDHYPNRG